MNKETVEIISAIESYLNGIDKEKISTEEIGFNITNLLIMQGLQANKRNAQFLQDMLKASGKNSLYT
jgi:hypothetical protein